MKEEGDIRVPRKRNRGWRREKIVYVFQSLPTLVRALNTKFQHDPFV
jgi:hypothetical protein